MLDNSRFGLYALCDIDASEELTCDYNYEATEVGACLICHCGERICDRTLL
jgi:SET domain-containing protein